MRVTLCVALCATFAGGATRAAAQTPTTKPVDPVSRTPVQLTWDQKIPMRDGVKLSAVVYRDPRQTQRVPVILTMTPYMAEGAMKMAQYLAQRGYVFVAIDSRGRGNSEGAFVPGQVEAKDAYDAIEWAAQQPWSDGQVATWGGSWLGFTQWSVAKEFPPHLKAMAPTASVHPGVDYPQPNGVFMSYMLRWLGYVNGRALNRRLFEDAQFWVNNEWQQLSSGRPFQALDETSGITNTVFRTWLQHPREDAFWQALTPRPADYAKLRIPVLTITGHYDGDQKGALTYYERHLSHGPADVTARHSLIIGPWNHAGTRVPEQELGGVSFGPTSMVDIEALHKAWYDHVLKAGPAPEFLKDRVACFVMGRNVWIYAPALKQIEGAALKLSLDATAASPGDVFRAGRLLSAAPTAAATVTLTSDPKYMPPREELERDEKQYLKDQHYAYLNLPNVVTLQSAPFPAETVLAGRPKLRLQVAVDQPDADLWVELYEVLPDGSAIYLSGREATRLRYRNNAVQGTPMVPGKPTQIEFAPLPFFSRSIAKGSRIRLVIDAGPRFGWQRNSHTGGNLATEPGSAGRVAKVTIRTGPGTGSMLELPRPDASVLKAVSEPGTK